MQGEVSQASQSQVHTNHVLLGQAHFVFLTYRGNTYHFGVIFWEESVLPICSDLPFGAGYIVSRTIWSRAKPNRPQNVICVAILFGGQIVRCNFGRLSISPLVNQATSQSGL